MLYRIFFGRNINKDGRADYVTDNQIAAFQREYLAFAFADGFTAIHAQGGWRDATTGNTITEDSLIVEVFNAPRAAVEYVASAYKRHFHQDAVMVQKLPIEAEFI